MKLSKKTINIFYISVPIIIALLFVFAFKTTDKGAFNPLFLFSKNDKHIIDSYEIKIDKMNIIEINNSDDIEKLFKEV